MDIYPSLWGGGAAENIGCDAAHILNDFGCSCQCASPADTQICDAAFDRLCKPSKETQFRWIPFSGRCFSLLRAAAEIGSRHLYWEGAAFTAAYKRYLEAAVSSGHSEHEVQALTPQQYR